MKTDFFDYFGDRQQRYGSRISLSEPLVLRFDGKNCTSNGIRDLTKPGEGTFAAALVGAGEKLASKYKALVYVAMDELSLIIPEAKILFARVNSVKTQDIVSIVSQELFLLFNEKYKGPKPVYFSACCFSVPNNKIVSYLSYRSSICGNSCRVYYSKKKHLGFHVDHPKKADLEKLLNEKSDYANEPIYAKEGLLITCGKLCSVSGYINGSYVSIDKNTLDISESNEGHIPLIISEYKKMEPNSEEQYLQNSRYTKLSSKSSKVIRIEKNMRFRAINEENINGAYTFCKNVARYPEKHTDNIQINTEDDSGSEFCIELINSSNPSKELKLSKVTPLEF